MTLEMIKMQQQEIGFAKGLARGRNEGIIIGTEQMARNMLNRGFSVQDMGSFFYACRQALRR